MKKIKTKVSETPPQRIHRTNEDATKDLIESLNGIFDRDYDDDKGICDTARPVREITWEHMMCNIPYEAVVKERFKEWFANRIIEPFKRMKIFFYKKIYEKIFIRPI
jgi:hypothetical protein